MRNSLEGLADDDHPQYILPRFVEEDWGEWRIVIDKNGKDAPTVFHWCEDDKGWKHTRGLNDTGEECRICGEEVPPGIKFRSLVLRVGVGSCGPIEKKP
jgi:hypothetical protein